MGRDYHAALPDSFQPLMPTLIPFRRLSSQFPRPGLEYQRVFWGLNDLLGSRTRSWCDGELSMQVR